MVCQLTGNAAADLLGRRASRLRRLQALRAFEQAEARGESAPPEVLAWLAAGVRDFLSIGGHLELHLGIASSRKGRHQSASSALARHERDLAILAVYAGAPGGSQAEKTAATVRIIHGRAAATDDAARSALQVLRRSHPHVGLPHSGRQIARIVHACAAGADVCGNLSVTSAATSLSCEEPLATSQPEEQDGY